MQLVPELRGRALRLCRDETMAEDLTQEAIERALVFASSYERGTNLRAWAHRILFSVFVTRYRRARRERNALRALASDPCAWTVPERFAPPDAAAPLLPSTRGTLEGLPDAFRAVVTLIDLDDLTYREAAAELGLPMGTVMSRLHRARRLLASQLSASAEARPDAA